MNQETTMHVSSFRSTKRPLKRKNKVSPKQKQNDDELTKSLTLYMNEKMKKMEGAKDIFGKTVANGLWLIRNTIIDLLN